MKEVQFGRRTFLKSMTFISAFATFEGGKFLLGHGGGHEMDADHPGIINNSRSSSAPADAVKFFDEASTAALLAIYPNFFPRLMSTRATCQVPEALERAATLIITPKNPHRLIALPAVAAAHAVSTTNERKIRERLWDRIAHTLANPNREVREIVLQNLLTAALPSPDGIERWDVDDGVLEKVLQVIKEAEDLPQLLSPASIGLVVMLNTRAVLSHKGTTAAMTRAAHIDRFITRALTPRPTHFGYLRRLKKAYEHDFPGYDPHDICSLPSHPTEMILQSCHARRFSSNYNREISLIHARTTYEAWRTMSGRSRANHVMTQAQAERAFGKLIEFEAASSVQRTLGEWHHEYVKKDRLFHLFVRDELLPRLNGFERLHPDCQHMADLGKLPRALSSYNWQGTADRVGPKVLNFASDLLLTFFAHYSFHHFLSNRESGTLEALSRRQENAPVAGESPKIPIEHQEEMERAAQEAFDADQECGEEMDAREHQIGPAKVRLSKRPTDQDHSERD